MKAGRRKAEGGRWKVDGGWWMVKGGKWKVRGQWRGRRWAESCLSSGAESALQGQLCAKRHIIISPLAQIQSRNAIFAPDSIQSEQVRIGDAPAGGYGEMAKRDDGR